MNYSVNSKKKLSLAATIMAISALLCAGTNSVLAQNETDFKIKEFGIKDGKPWLSVEGKAGASTPQNASQIFAYAFVTDKGIFAATSHGVEDSSEVTNDTEWHSHGVTHTISIANTNATKLDKVMTAQLGINNADASVCVEKVFDSKP